MPAFNEEELREPLAEVERWMAETLELARTLIWENGPPLGFTVMSPEERDLVLEEIEVGRLQEIAGKKSGRDFREVAEHPTIEHAQHVRMSDRIRAAQARGETIRDPRSVPDG